MPLSLVDDVRTHLKTHALGRTLRGKASVPSTNTEAAQWARQGAPHGSVVVTEFQTAGRGRQGRSWRAAAGQNLMFSVVLRPSFPLERLGLLPIAAGVAVADAVHPFIAPHEPTLKWPNDVLIEGQKICGILSETSFAGPRAAPGAAGGKPGFVVLGIGLNVNQTQFPEALSETATSLRLASGRLVPRAVLFARLLERLEERSDALATASGAPRLRDAFHHRMHRRGEPATLHVPGTERTVSGTVRGITDDGALLLDTDAGRRAVYAGDVTSHSPR